MPADLMQATEWTQADPDHAGVDPRFWVHESGDIARDNGRESYVMSDEHGDVLFVRVERIARVYIQFGAAKTDSDRERNRKAMSLGLKWLGGALGTRGFREIIFSTKSFQIAAHALRRLKFNRRDVLSLRIPVYLPSSTRPDNVSQTPQATLSTQ